MLSRSLAKQEYLFRRVFFMISEEELVELVAIMIGTNHSIYTELHESKDTVASESRELHISSLTRNKAKVLLNKEFLIEEITINHHQFNYLIDHYKGNLLGVTKEIINSIKKGQ